MKTINIKKDNGRFSIVMLIVILAFSLVVAGCSTKAQSPTPGLTGELPSGTAQATTGDVERIEVFHFHGNNQCSSCIAVGALAEETVNTYFADEVAAGKVRFAHINAELPENVALARQYGVTGSSLWIGVYHKDGSFSAEQNTNVWYKINDKSAYLTYLKGIIDQKLAE